MTLDELKEFVKISLDETNKNLERYKGKTNEHDYYLGKFTVLQIIDEYLEKLGKKELK